MPARRENEARGPLTCELVSAVVQVEDPPERRPEGAVDGEVERERFAVETPLGTVGYGVEHQGVAAQPCDLAGLDGGVRGVGGVGREGAVDIRRKEVESDAEGTPARETGCSMGIVR
jgi:hypothetical protein